MISILRLGDVFTIKKQLIITLIYGFIIIIIFFTPKGITFSEQWRPIFSWGFLILVYITLTVIILLPILWYSRRLIKMFQDKKLKRKLITFLIGVFGMILSIYGTVLYITWQGSLFSSLWSILTTFVIIPSALLTYYGIGRDL